MGCIVPGTSQVPGEPRLSVCTCSNPTPAGLLAPDHYGAAAWPLVEQRQRLPRKVFRSSIAWLSDSLSTLRRTGYPATTQDSLPAAGQALPDGLSTRKVPTKGFKAASLHLILPSQALLGAKLSSWVVSSARGYGPRICSARHHLDPWTPRLSRNCSRSISG